MLGSNKTSKIIDYDLSDISWPAEADTIIRMIGGGIETKDIANTLGWSNSNTSLKIKKIKDFISTIKKHELTPREFTIICYNFYRLDR